MQPRLYTTHDIAKLIQADASTVAKWIDGGKLLAYRTPGGHRRVREDDLRTFLNTHQMPIPEELGSGKVRLLIVDDEQPILTSLTRALRPYADAIEVVTTTSGVEAGLLALETRPNAILIDVNLPDLNGFELIRQLSARPQLKGLRVVMMSAKFSPALEAEARRAGASTLLAKPVDPTVLLELIGARAARGTRA